MATVAVLGSVAFTASNAVPVTHLGTGSTRIHGEVRQCTKDQGSDQGSGNQGSSGPTESEPSATAVQAGRGVALQAVGQAAGGTFECRPCDGDGDSDAPEANGLPSAAVPPALAPAAVNRFQSCDSDGDEGTDGSQG